MKKIILLVLVLVLLPYQISWGQNIGDREFLVVDTGWLDKVLNIADSLPTKVTVDGFYERLEIYFFKYDSLKFVVEELQYENDSLRASAKYWEKKYTVNSVWSKQAVQDTAPSYKYLEEFVDPIDNLQAQIDSLKADIEVLKFMHTTYKNSLGRCDWIISQDGEKIECEYPWEFHHFDGTYPSYYDKPRDFDYWKRKEQSK